MHAWHCVYGQEPMIRDLRGPGLNLWLSLPKCPLNLDLYTHKLVQCLDLIREVSVCNKWQITQRLTTVQLQRLSTWIAQPNTEQLFTPVPPTQGSGDLAEEGTEELYKSQFFYHTPVNTLMPILAALIVLGHFGEWERNLGKMQRCGWIWEVNIITVHCMHTWPVQRINRNKMFM